MEYLVIGIVALCLIVLVTVIIARAFRQAKRELEFEKVARPPSVIAAAPVFTPAAPAPVSKIKSVHMSKRAAAAEWGMDVSEDVSDCAGPIADCAQDCSTPVSDCSAPSDCSSSYSSSDCSSGSSCGGGGSSCGGSF